MVFSCVGLAQHVLRTSPACLWAHHVLAHAAAKLVMPLAIAAGLDCWIGQDMQNSNLYLQLALHLRWGAVNSSVHPFPEVVPTEHNLFKLFVVLILPFTH